MKLEGIHHITAITADAPRNVDFYAGTLGLRMVKKTVNQDDPTVYHLFYGDEHGSPGADLTFFEYPGAPRGRVGAGMVHRIVWRVGSEEALRFWEERLSAAGAQVERVADGVLFEDPEGLEHRLSIYHGAEEPLSADAADVPAALALQGFAGVHAYASEPEASAPLLAGALGFARDPERSWTVAGERRSSFYSYDAPPPERGRGGAGTVHHVAFASQPEDHEPWRERVLAAGAQATPVIDRFYFRSVYFREPSGVLFELATIGPGFAADEDPEHLGERLSLPPAFEPLRSQIEPALTPIENPRSKNVKA
jgi:glyoxalase family protein